MSMTTIVKLIVENKPDYVRSHLDRCHQENDADVYQAFDWNKYTGLPIAGTADQTEITILHLAVANVLRWRFMYNPVASNNALEILKIICWRGGASLTKIQAKGCKFTSPIVVDFNNMTPIQLVFAAQDVSRKNNFSDLQHVIDILRLVKSRYEIAPSEQKDRRNEALKAHVVTAAEERSERLRAMTQFCDLHFVFCDGVIIPAHKCVLVAQSPYFEGFFQSSWVDVHKGQWETHYDSTMINALLDFVYMSHIEPMHYEKECFSIYTMAMEYQIAHLQKLARVFVIDSLAVDTVKPALQLALLHSDILLKHACAYYIQRNAVSVLMSPAFATLSKDDPELWCVVTGHLTPA
jgi:hypothetical protein